MKNSELLLTDLYQLTMLQGYYRHGLSAPAAFEFFVRDLPPQRRFLVAAGLEQVVEYLLEARFTDEELRWLLEEGRFAADFVDYLAQWRFSGDVDAMPEGTVFFPQEPILRVVAPIGEAQLVETRLVNLLHFQTLIAAKAARCVLAAPGKLLVDFGLRRAHGAEAGLLAARACYLAGFAGTSTVAAAAHFDIPAYGTMAHSFIQAHDDEMEAFEHFAGANPDSVVFLIDTYDTEAAAAKVVALAPRLRRRGIAVKAVRLDSGDLADHARRVRAILDEGGLTEVRIFVSGNLDEYVLRELLARNAPIDGFGVGTRLDTSADVPYLDCAYKLVEYEGQPRRKRSEGKATWPGRKQVYRRYEPAGTFAGDQVALEGEPQAGEPLLQPVIRRGRRVAPAERLEDIRERMQEQLERLPPSLRDGSVAGEYPVSLSPGLRDLAAQIDGRLPS